MKVLALGGWALAVLFALAAAWQAQQARAARQAAEDASASVAAALAMHEQLETEANTLRDAFARLEREVEARAADSAPGEDDAGGFDFAALAEQLGAAGAPGEPAGEQADPMSGFGEAMQHFMSDEMVGHTADMSIGMMYSDLFELLMLPPEQEEAVRAIMREAFMEQMKQAREMMGGGGEEHAHDEDADARVRAALAEVLDPESLALYDAYEEELPRRMMEQSMDMQLSMAGLRLDPETHIVVRDVFVEELYTLQELHGSGGFGGGFGGSGFGGGFGGGADGEERSMAQIMQEQADSYYRALERVDPVLDEQQYNNLERWVRQQTSMMEAMIPMMESMRPGRQEAE